MPRVGKGLIENHGLNTVGCIKTTAVKHKHKFRRNKLNGRSWRKPPAALLRLRRHVSNHEKNGNTY
eukprot:12524315-Prorocentrum_lima.AAC.1